MSTSSRSAASASGGKMRVTFSAVMANIATGRSGKEVAFRFGEGDDTTDSNRSLR